LADFPFGLHDAELIPRLRNKYLSYSTGLPFFDLVSLLPSIKDFFSQRYL